MWTPKVAVIMAVYNTEAYVWEAIYSILSQSFSEFEFIIIDDNSSDNSYQICKEYAEKDSRIQLFRNKNNNWVVKTRNKLLEKIPQHIEYISIIDADDLAKKSRNEKQIIFLQCHQDYSLIGTNLEIINEEGDIIWYRQYAQDNKEVSKVIGKKSPLAQPSVMIRKKDLNVIWRYNEDYERCQDYELWFRFFDWGYKIWNLQEALTQYRIFPNQWKSKYVRLSLKNTIMLQRRYIFKKKYFSVTNLLYFLWENLLMFFPDRIILFLFSKISYTWKIN